jgi:hypothetical protein
LNFESRGGIGDIEGKRSFSEGTESVKTGATIGENEGTRMLGFVLGFADDLPPIL